MMNRQWMQRCVVIAVLAAVGMSSGCGMQVKHAKGSPYSGGYQQHVGASSRDVRDAIQEVVSEMELHVIQERLTAADGIMEVRSATGQQVYLMFKLIDPYKTYLEVHKPKDHPAWLAQTMRDQITLKAEIATVRRMRELRKRVAARVEAETNPQ